MEYKTISLQIKLLFLIFKKFQKNMWLVLDVVWINSIIAQKSEGIKAY